MLFGSHQLAQKEVGLRSKKSATAGLQWGRWIPIEASLEAVKTRDTVTKHWLLVRFGKLGKIRTEFLQLTIAAASFAVVQFDSALSRAPTATTQEMWKTWTEVLELQITNEGKPATPLHEWADDVDALLIFGGPTNIVQKMCEGNGVATIPNLENLAGVLYNVLNDVHFASAMVGVLKSALEKNK